MDDLIADVNRALRARGWSAQHASRQLAGGRGIGGLTRGIRSSPSVRCGGYPDATLDLDEVFLFEATRVVHKDRTVSLNGRLYEVDAILGFLRDIQRRFATAVLLVHHARKSGATRPAQALRGSSELHAWGDSNLYLRRRDRQILMTVEHRAAAGLNDIEIELADDGKGPALRLRQVGTAEAAPRPETPERRILQALAEADAPLSQRQIRERAATRHHTVGAVLRTLVRKGRIHHDAEGRYRLVASPTDKARAA